MEPDECLPIVLGDQIAGVSIVGMRYAYEKRSDPDWLAVDLIVSRDGRRYEQTSVFMHTGDLAPLADWFEGLAAKTAGPPREAGNHNAGPMYVFDDPVEMEAVAWGPQGVRMRFREYTAAAWASDDLTYGDPALFPLVTVSQLTAAAAALRRCAESWPYREEGWDWQTPVALSVLLLILVLLGVGAVTTVRWLIALVL